MGDYRDRHQASQARKHVRFMAREGADALMDWGGDSPVVKARRDALVWKYGHLPTWRTWQRWRGTAGTRGVRCCGQRYAHWTSQSSLSSVPKSRIGGSTRTAGTLATRRRSG
jgi:hypothetical protein